MNADFWAVYSKEGAQANQQKWLLQTMIAKMTAEMCAASDMADVQEAHRSFESQMNSTAAKKVFTHFKGGKQLE